MTWFKDYSLQTDQCLSGTRVEPSNKGNIMLSHFVHSLHVEHFFSYQRSKMHMRNKVF